MHERLLEYFANSENGFVSGEFLSRQFQCSRTAIWKQIQALRQQGYRFEAIPRSGYRLVEKPEKLNLIKLRGHIHTQVMGSVIYLYDVVDSTQNVAHELVKQGAAEGTIVIADQQTMGRGRMGRRWHSPKGKGIWLSLILKPRIPVQFTSQLTLLTAVALCRSLQPLVKQQVGIKWPNDLLIGGRKVSGILLESSTEDERLNYVIAGIGISANLAAADYPDDLSEKATSLLIESGQAIDRELLAGRFMQQFEELYDLYHQQGFAPIRLLWEALTISLHCPIRIQTAAGLVECIAQSIDEIGALCVLQADGSMVKLYAGDILL